MKAADVARGPFGLLKANTIAEWQADRALLAAALAYHTLFGHCATAGHPGRRRRLVPLGPAMTRQNVVGQVLRYTGKGYDVAALVQTIIEQSARPTASVAATVAGVVMLLWGASNLFGELAVAQRHLERAAPQTGLDRPAGAGSRHGACHGHGHGALLLAPLVLTTALAATSQRLAGGWITQVLAFLGFYAVTLLIFEALRSHAFCPTCDRVARRARGHHRTALLHRAPAHRPLPRLLLRRSASGAAGSLVVVLL